MDHDTSSSMRQILKHAEAIQQLALHPNGPVSQVASKHDVEALEQAISKMLRNRLSCEDEEKLDHLLTRTRRITRRLEALAGQPPDLH